MMMIIISVDCFLHLSMLLLSLSTNLAARAAASALICPE